MPGYSGFRALRNRNIKKPCVDFCAMAVTCTLILEIQCNRRLHTKKRCVPSRFPLSLCLYAGADKPTVRRPLYTTSSLVRWAFGTVRSPPPPPLHGTTQSLTHANHSHVHSNLNRHHISALTSAALTSAALSPPQLSPPQLSPLPLLPSTRTTSLDCRFANGGRQRVAGGGRPLGAYSLSLQFSGEPFSAASVPDEVRA
jgi:hypothetical protein